MYLCHLAKSVKEVGIRSDPPPCWDTGPNMFFFYEPSLREAAQK